MIHDNQSQQDNRLEQNVSNSSSNPSQNKGTLRIYPNRAAAKAAAKKRRPPS